MVAENWHYKIIYMKKKFLLCFMKKSHSSMAENCHLKKILIGMAENCHLKTNLIGIAENCHSIIPVQPGSQSLFNRERYELVRQFATVYISMTGLTPILFFI